MLRKLLIAAALETLAIALAAFLEERRAVAGLRRDVNRQLEALRAPFVARARQAVFSRP